MHDSFPVSTAQTIRAVGDRDRNHLWGLGAPRAASARGILRGAHAAASRRLPQDRERPGDQDAPQVSVASLGDGSSRCLPPVDSSRETMPIQAAKSRPVLKIEASGTVATIALAPMTPIPGMVSARVLSTFLRCCARSRFSIATICSW